MSELCCARCGARLGTSLSGLCPRCLLAGDGVFGLVGGDLELGEEIGRGAMGHVFRARHVRLGRAVAVKFLSPELANDAEMKQRFAREARSLALLSHPHIVQIFDCGEDAGASYIVMELVEGRPLSACLPMPARAAVDIVLQICDALTYAHGVGIVHRDIKPENVLIDASGHVKVSDFGIARLMAPAASGWDLTQTGVTCGTPAYLAPETLAGAPPDARTDVYALGVVLYQTVTGRLPVGNFEPLPSGLDRIVRRALTSDPERRTPSAMAFADELRQLRLGGDLELSDDERFWIYGAALLSSAAAAVGVWAVMTSVTPRVVRSDELSPLTHVISEQLADGRWVSYARFETWPILGTVAALGVAFAALGLLRRHWRDAGLDVPRPMRPVLASRKLAWVGGSCVVMYLARRWLEASGLGRVSLYTPLLGGLLELAALFYLFVGLLEAWRTARPLAREPLLFWGMGLALLPPVLEFGRFLSHWQP